MKISRISVFQVDLTIGDYKLSGGRSYSILDNTIIRIETDNGFVGWGESCPFGANYDQSFAGGVRAGIALLAPELLGMDPRETEKVAGLMNTTLKGHAYAKAGLDVACLDVFARSLDLPLYMLLGGKLVDHIPINSSTPVNDVASMAEKMRSNRAEGFRLHSVKMSGDVSSDVERIRTLADLMTGDDRFTVDCNGGWQVHEALRVANAVSDIDVYLEQPCAGYDECLTVRRNTSLPMLMDESAVSLDAIVKAQAEAAFDVIKFKMSRLGGLSMARKTRDFCVHMDLPVWIQDTGGAEITTAAIAHLCHSTPPALLFGGVWCSIFTDVRTASSGVNRSGGFMTATDEPGLGVTPDPKVLGRAIAVYE